MLYLVISVKKTLKLVFPKSTPLMTHIKIIFWGNCQVLSHTRCFTHWTPQLPSCSIRILMCVFYNLYDVLLILLLYGVFTGLFKCLFLLLLRRRQQPALPKWLVSGWQYYGKYSSSFHPGGFSWISLSSVGMVPWRQQAFLNSDELAYWRF